MQEFITPPNHKGFSAKKLFDENGKIKWGAIAYIEKGVADRREIIHIAITISLS